MSRRGAQVRPQFWLPLLLLVVAYALRILVMPQSLWYDEMYTVLHYTSQPWERIVAGRYSPNNHILSSLLIKATDEAGTQLGVWPAATRLTVGDAPLIAVPDDTTTRYRLPSMVAGALASLALAWPLLQRDAASPRELLPFAGLALLGAAHPWLLALSTEARGYALALLFAVVATNLLTKLTTRRMILYVLAMTAALYTIPLAAAILLAHGVTVALLLRRELRRWLLAAALVALGTILLYMPFLSAMRASAATMAFPVTYGDFLLQTFAAAGTGWNHMMPWSVIVTLVVLAGGVPLAWRSTPALRPLLVTFGTASLVALLLPTVHPGLRQARFALWLIPLAVLGSYGLIMLVPTVRLRTPRFAVGGLVALWMAWQDLVLARIPPQPILDAMLLVDRTAPPDARVVGLHLGGQDALVLYAHFLGERSLDFVYDDNGWRKLAATPGPTVIMVFYPDVAASQLPAVMGDLRARYTRQAVLPGRVSPVEVYVSRGAQPAPASR